MWIPKDLHSHSHPSSKPPLDLDLTPLLPPPQLPWPPSSAPQQPRYGSFHPSLFLPPNQSPTDLVRPVSTVRFMHCTRTMIDQNSIWCYPHLSHPWCRLQGQEFPTGHRPPQAPTSSLPLLIFRSLHPSPCSFPQKLISSKSRELSLSGHRDSLPCFCGKHSPCRV